MRPVAVAPVRTRHVLGECRWSMRAQTAQMGKAGQGSGGVAVGMPDEGRLAKVPAA